MEIYHKFVNYLIKNKITISTAESCTGGLIAKLITDIPGSSEVFIGGVVSYSNEMKCKILGVDSRTLASYGAVSEQTVKEMLSGIIQLTKSDAAIAVSGVAGPGGGTEEKPVGTVFIGIAFLNQHFIKRCLFEGTRDRIREESATTAIRLFAELFINDVTLLK